MGLKTDIQRARFGAKSTVFANARNLGSRLLAAALPDRTLPDQKYPIVVYVIDDDDAVRMALRRVFRAAGLHCMEFASVGEFLSSEVSMTGACIVTDMNLADESPEELPRLVQEQSAGAPVIFISADDSEENRQRVEQAGGAGFFKKPVDDQALIDAVKWALRGCVCP